MPIKVLELHHVGFGVNHAQADAMLDFYREVLNLPQDAARWKIPGIYGSWINLPNGSQLHILGSEGPSRYAQGPGKDPVIRPATWWNCTSPVRARPASPRPSRTRRAPATSEDSHVF
jgi:catechol 2,3-dioxygenase-like lactoylglutathione lyase family enzyme